MYFVLLCVKVFHLFTLLRFVYFNFRLKYRPPGCWAKARRLLERICHAFSPSSLRCPVSKKNPPQNRNLPKKYIKLCNLFKILLILCVEEIKKAPWWKNRKKQILDASNLQKKTSAGRIWLCDPAVGAVSQQLYIYFRMSVGVVWALVRRVGTKSEEAVCLRYCTSSTSISLVAKSSDWTLRSGYFDSKYRKTWAWLKKNVTNSSDEITWSLLKAAIRIGEKYFWPK